MKNDRYFLAIMIIGMPLALFCQTFQDVSTEAGINFLFEEVGSMGGGAAFFDYNNDGFEDLYVTGGKTADRLYKNNGDGTFTDVSSEAGLFLTDNYYTTGVVTGDFNNDGWREIFVTTWFGQSLVDPEARNLLFYNNGDGTFTEMGAFAGIVEGALSIGATLLDFDRDGLLDIYIINYIDESGFIYDDEGQTIGFAHQCYPNFFYRNNGDLTFTEMATSLGIADAGCGLAVTGTDYNQDGLLDVYIANDFGEWLQPNSLFQNMNTDTFINVSAAASANIGMYGMGIAVGDYDQDLDLDMYITNIGRNVLLNNNGDGTYLDLTTETGVENTFSSDTTLSIGWGTVFLDYDHDTYEDLFVINGFVPTPPFIATSLIDPDKLYKNNGDATFSDVSNLEGFNDDNRGRGLAYSDYDQDGDLDLFVNIQKGSADANAQMRLYRNNTDNNYHWLQVKLTGVECNRDAFGSKVWVYLDNQILVREISGGSSHCSHHSSIAHFGLGLHSQIDSVKVDWLGGSPQVIHNPPVNQVLAITQGDDLTSTLQVADQKAVKLVPNPGKDFVYLHLDPTLQLEKSVHVFDYTGRQVMHTTIAPQNQDHILNINDLAPGIYFVQISSGSQYFLKKLVKAK